MCFNCLRLDRRTQGSLTIYWSGAKQELFNKAGSLSRLRWFGGWFGHSKIYLKTCCTWDSVSVVCELKTGRWKRSLCAFECVFPCLDASRMVLYPSYYWLSQLWYQLHPKSHRESTLTLSSWQTRLQRYFSSTTVEKHKWRKCFYVR